MDEVTRRVSVTVAGLHHLLRQPLRGGMSGHAGVHNLTAPVIYYKEDVQGPEPDRTNRE
jgi:hypothetical protein